LLVLLLVLEAGLLSRGIAAEALAESGYTAPPLPALVPATLSAPQLETDARQRPAHVS
jgi:hypothetical protein